MWHKVDHAGHSARTVDHRTRASNHFDRLNITQIHSSVVADEGLVEDVVIENRAVGKQEQAVVHVVGLPQTSNGHVAVDRVKGLRHAACARSASKTVGY